MLEFVKSYLSIATQLQTYYGSFGFVVSMILVADFMGNVINSFQEPPASVCSVWTTVFTANFRNVFKNRCFSSGLTYLCLKTTVYFLRCTGFSLLYANFDNLLEIRCDQPQLLRTADQCLDLVFVLLFVH